MVKMLQKLYYSLLGLYECIPLVQLFILMININYTSYYIQGVLFIGVKLYMLVNEK